MVQLILSDDQAKVVSAAGDAIQLVDPHGKHLGYVSAGFSPRDVTEAERRARSDGPWYTTEEVLKHLASLEQA